MSTLSSWTKKHDWAHLTPEKSIYKYTVHNIGYCCLAVFTVLNTHSERLLSFDVTIQTTNTKKKKKSQITKFNTLVATAYVLTWIFSQTFTHNKEWNNLTFLLVHMPSMWYLSCQPTYTCQRFPTCSKNVSCTTQTWALSLDVPTILRAMWGWGRGEERNYVR